VLTYRQLQESGKLQEHFGADSMIVATVTTGEQRLQNLNTTTAVEQRALLAIM
jgi:hypothetical protein